MNVHLQAPLEHRERLGDFLGIDLYVQRDDLLPFPLAGNKVRKIRAEVAHLPSLPDVLVTNGAVNSNHCRTTAFIAAELGLQSHLVLHGSGAASDDPAVKILQELGATTVVVEPREIGQALAAAVDRAREAGLCPHVIPGGCHSPSGAAAYRDVGLEVFSSLRPDFVFLPSGTGATQGGLQAAATMGSLNTRVIGVSVAREAERGIAPVQEAAAWAGAVGARVDFDDRFRAGGYGLQDEATRQAVALGWSHGLPLDGTYTGKAFAALMAYAESGYLEGARVLFWHTGGLWNHLQGLGAS